MFSFELDGNALYVFFKRGEKGLRGATGDEGRPGQTGHEGLPGPMGAQGLEGEAGVPGATGPRGLPVSAITNVQYRHTQPPVNDQLPPKLMMMLPSASNDKCAK